MSKECGVGSGGSANSSTVPCMVRDELSWSRPTPSRAGLDPCQSEELWKFALSSGPDRAVNEDRCARRAAWDSAWKCAEPERLGS
eukprot:1280997-Rhodomonas_salina.3